ncbi:hypothetical protein [Halorubrum sp. F4]|uniref:hypothetical protein n=1 Tax=Halorubrum sp. F4 TaxID=2989715 RepID=UPI002480D25A|nr:hypothetical protein [Halorubrum sp. F4]
MSDFSHDVDEEVEVEIRRNGNGSVLAYVDRDRAEEAFDNHREVLRSLYDLVDRRHGSNGETVARLEVREDGLGEILVRDEYVREIGTDRALALADQMRYHAESPELVTDGGVDQDDDDLARIADTLELQNALLLQLVQDQRREAAREHRDPDHTGASDHSTATDVVDAYGDLYGGSIGWEFDPVSDQVDGMGDSR